MIWLFTFGISSKSIAAVVMKIKGCQYDSPCRSRFLFEPGRSRVKSYFSSRGEDFKIKNEYVKGIYIDAIVCKEINLFLNQIIHLFLAKAPSRQSKVTQPRDLIGIINFFVITWMPSEYAPFKSKKVEIISNNALTHKIPLNPWR